jgi:glycosyltransferase involved in cell wall biosynthesis
MHVVFDAIAVRAGSASIVVEHELAAWARRTDGDQLTVLTSAKTELPIPDGVAIEQLEPPLGGPLGEVWLRSFGVRRAAKRLNADAVISGVTASAFAGTACPRWAIVYDVRHEIRPAQFSLPRRIVRRVSYRWTFRRAAGLFCISARTRHDLVRKRRWLAGKALVTTLGSDHVDGWPHGDMAAPYALAFGNFGNKNADKVLAAWAEYCKADATLTLRLVGMSKDERAGLTSQAAELGIANRVELMPWLDDDQFQQLFTGARLVIFPSDFEGYGLPAVEAMRLRLPVVISTDEALAEVTGGHATIAHDLAPKPLAEAIRQALATAPDQLEIAYRFIEPITWAATAETMRSNVQAVLRQ